MSVLINIININLEGTITRIIAGSAGGLKLKTLKGDVTRPTADRVKEAVFNILLPYLTDSCVLDLFSGSGGLGIEALSRGAKTSVFVDKDRQACNIIKENINYAGFDEKSSVLNMDCFTAVNFLQGKDFSFDIIFLDPPYPLDLWDKAIEKILKSGILSNRGIIVLEVPSKREVKQYENMSILKHRSYGNVEVLFYTLLEKNQERVNENICIPGKF